MNRTTIGNTNNFSLLSLIFGVLGVITFCTGITPLIFGGLAILFGLLSRGTASRPSGQGTAGIILGIIALLIIAAMCIYSFVYVHNEYGSMVNYLNETLSQTEDLMESYLKQIY